MKPIQVCTWTQVFASEPREVTRGQNLHVLTGHMNLSETRPGYFDAAAQQTTRKTLGQAIAIALEFMGGHAFTLCHNRAEPIPHEEATD